MVWRKERLPRAGGVKRLVAYAIGGDGKVLDQFTVTCPDTEPDEILFAQADAEIAGRTRN